MKRKYAAFLALLLTLTMAVGCGAANASYKEDTMMSTVELAAPAEIPAEAEMELYRRETAMTATQDAGLGFYDEEPIDDYDDGYEASYSGGDEPETGGGIEMPVVPETQPVTDQPRKIVYTMDISLQTNDFDAGTKKIPQMVESVGGFVQDSYVEGTDMHARYYSRSANFVVRIPVDKLDSYISSLGEGFHLVSQRKSSSDITGNYYDTKARIDSLETQRERLMAMLEGATELQYMLEVERELANVLYQIETMTSSLNRMDSSVQYSTVTIYLQEVTEYIEEPNVAPATFGDRIRDTFNNSIKGLIAFCQNAVLAVISLIQILPVLLVILVIILLIIRSNRRYAKRRAAKAAALLQNAEQAPSDTTISPDTQETKE